MGHGTLGVRNNNSTLLDLSFFLFTSKDKPSDGHGECSGRGANIGSRSYKGIFWGKTLNTPSSLFCLLHLGQRLRMCATIKRWIPYFLFLVSFKQF